MGRVVSAILSLAVLTATAGLFAAPLPEPAAPSNEVSLWEAYSRGHVEIEQVDVTYNGVPYGPIGFQVRNTGPADVRISEYAILLSPNPREGSFGVTGQDGMLTKAIVPAGTNLDYMYGDLVASGTLPAPAWWCTEQFQYTQGGVLITLGGEILPFAMESIVSTMVPSPDGTQDHLWEYLRTNPSPVIGKTVDGAFWEEIPETAGQVLRVEIRATNLAIKDTGDNVPDPDAPNALVWDVVPAGYTLDEATIQPTGYTITPLPDGAKRVSWPADLPAADVTGWGDGSLPTPYISRAFTYSMATPHLTPGRASLPRAMVSAGNDLNAEANSELPVMDVLKVPQPPIPNAGSGYDANEGDTVTFSAAKSTDPNGDPLQFRWDFTADGTWDTAWSSDPTASATFADDFSGNARVEVTDLVFTVSAEAPVVIHNVAPTADAGPDKAASEGALVAFTFAFSDPGFDDPARGTVEDFTATVDWGYGPPEAASVVEVPGGVGVPTTGTVDLSHIYGDDGTFTVTVTVCDDDGGCGSDTAIATVGNVAPAIDFTVIPSGDEADTLTFQARVLDPGSDDLTVGWSGSCTGWSPATIFPNDPAAYPDPDPSPDVHPRDVTDTQTVVCGDNGAFDWNLKVEDDDGGVTTLSGTFSVGNLPPSLTVSPPTQLDVDEGALVSLDATATDPGSDDLTFAWAWQYGPTDTTTVFNDGVGPDLPNSPDGTYPFAASDSSSFTYGDDGAYLVTLTVTDDDGGSLTYTTTVQVSNVAPTVDAGADAATDEGASLGFLFVFTDPGFDQPAAGTIEDFTATVDWGYGSTESARVVEVPGSPGVPTAGTVSVTHVYGDDGTFTVTVTVCDDDGGCGRDSLAVTVRNVHPDIGDVQAYVIADLTLRVAGEKWHDVRMDLVWNGDVAGTARVVRYPGSPDRQSATIEGGRIQLLGDFSIVVYYTPEDDPVNGQPNGANPVWVILTMPDGSEVRLHHTFNVQHPSTWTWTLDDVRSYLVGQEITFEATASDVGSDDLVLAWDFGDGSTAGATYFNNGVSPDPFPSPEVNPITATDATTHAYASAGTYSVTLTVTDDDGGSASRTFVLSVG